MDYSQLLGWPCYKSNVCRLGASLLPFIGSLFSPEMILVASSRIALAKTFQSCSHWVYASPTTSDQPQIHVQRTKAISLELAFVVVIYLLFLLLLLPSEFFYFTDSLILIYNYFSSSPFPLTKKNSDFTLLNAQDRSVGTSQFWRFTSVAFFSKLHIQNYIFVYVCM